MFRIRDLTPEARLRPAEFGLKDQLPARELFFRLLPENPEYGEARKLAKMLGVDGNVVYTWIKRSDRRRAFLQAAYERKAQAESAEPRVWILPSRTRTVCARMMPGRSMGTTSTFTIASGVVLGTSAEGKAQAGAAESIMARNSSFPAGITVSDYR